MTHPGASLVRLFIAPEQRQRFAAPQNMRRGTLVCRSLGVVCNWWFESVDDRPGRTRVMK
jgi:hypothetical protein